MVSGYFRHSYEENGHRKTSVSTYPYSCRLVYSTIELVQHSYNFIMSRLGYQINISGLFLIRQCYESPYYARVCLTGDFLLFI